MWKKPAAAVGQRQMPGPAGTSAIMAAGTLVASPKADTQWVPRHSAEGEAIVAEADAQCPEGKPVKRCHPE